MLILSPKMPQRKVKQSKVKQSKVKPLSPDGKTAAAAATDREGEMIEKMFYQITGRRFACADRSALDGLYRQGATDELILRAMQEVAGRKHSAITSMKYFVPIVQDALMASYSGYADGRDMSVPTSDTDDVEAVLDAEWAKELRGLSGDYTYDDGDDFS